VPPEHPAFEVVPVKQPKDSGRVAPGMDVIYRIIFTPTEKQDYEFDLVVLTEREKFLVPIRSIGSRGGLIYFFVICVFPDVLTMFAFSSVPRFPIRGGVSQFARESPIRADFSRPQRWCSWKHVHCTVDGSVHCDSVFVLSRCPTSHPGPIYPMLSDFMISSFFLS
jgi:hypothetical protein